MEDYGTDMERVKKVFESFSVDPSDETEEVQAEVAPATDPTSTEWLTLKGDSYSLPYPAAWDLQQTRPGLECIIFSPLDKLGDSFKENVNLIIQDIANMGIDLDKYMEITEGQLPSQIEDISIELNERFGEGESAYHVLQYVGTTQGLKLKWKQFIQIVDEKAYVFTYTGSRDGFAGKVADADKMFKGFVVKGE